MTPRPKLFLHCGMTKSGSTAIQGALRASVDLLAEDGFAVLVDSSESRIRNELMKADSALLVPLRSDSEFVSAGSFHHQYRLHRAHIGEVSARRVLKGLQRATREAASNASAVVVSSEALEASLVMNDELLGDQLAELADEFDITIVVLARPLEEHVLSSWQEFCWNSGVLLSDWMSFYLRPCPPESFWNDLAQPYMGNLAQMDRWAAYWSNGNWTVTLVPINQVEGHDSISAFTSVLGTSVQLVSEEGSENLSWPATSVRTLPHLTNIFGGEYDNFHAIRRAVSSFGGNNAFDSAMRGTAIGLIHSSLASSLEPGLRSAERLLSIRPGSLGLEGQTDSNPTTAVEELRRWEQPGLADWKTLVTALSAQVVAPT